MTPQPHAHKVNVRLLGTEENVGFWVNMLDDIGTVTAVSDPEQARNGLVRVYFTLARRNPIFLGERP